MGQDRYKGELPGSNDDLKRMCHEVPAVYIEAHPTRKLPDRQK